MTLNLNILYCQVITLRSEVDIVIHLTHLIRSQPFLPLHCPLTNSFILSIILFFPVTKIFHHTEWSHML